jgi:hypothetical protein
MIYTFVSHSYFIHVRCASLYSKHMCHSMMNTALPIRNSRSAQHSLWRVILLERGRIRQGGKAWISIGTTL